MVIDIFEERIRHVWPQMRGKSVLYEEMLGETIRKQEGYTGTYMSSSRQWILELAVIYAPSSAPYNFENDMGSPHSQIVLVDQT